ncbi:transposase [Myxococcus llanfairpwllgwyngyllgogerychwyrndrobwllllantysiliogogogochensis]|uniref:Transposase n=1 Tax=Myxococcus llanfairpwllgwyngyllgogerychwyrndrobwllllantysiliogogogochensis TaxID=2590453 RepID=A0A540X6J3_9BACT|nr:transposase [Myxococcus llanfairpwllgwyngyllgogerychwyrndrobwllllantysiliogogogochensis]
MQSLSADAGHQASYSFLHLLLRAKWDADAVSDDVLEYARRALGEGGILAVDETGFMKTGEKSVGASRRLTSALRAGGGLQYACLARLLVSVKVDVA